MTALEIQQGVTVALPFIASAISYGLQQAHFNEYANAAIAGLTILMAAIVTVFFQGKLTGDVTADCMLVFATSTALQANALKPLHQYLQVKILPIPAKVDPQATLPRVKAVLPPSTVQPPLDMSHGG